ncbi:MAG: ATP synthase subunit I [Planctomycetota bacterium]
MLNLILLGAFAAGMALGAMFFGGLWWTVRRLPTSRHPARLAFGSLFTRLALALAGFFLVLDGQWPRGLACLAGFLAVRMVLVWRLGAPLARPAKQKEARP